MVSVYLKITKQHNFRDFPVAFHPSRKFKICICTCMRLVSERTRQTGLQIKLGLLSPRGGDIAGVSSENKWSFGIQWRKKYINIFHVFLSNSEVK